MLIRFLPKIYHKIEDLFPLYPFHFKVDFGKFPPYLKIQSHESFVSDKRKEISAISINSSYKKLIKTIFETAKGCNFVIFDDFHKTEFFQFWIGNRIYYFDFPMGEYNTNGLYREKLMNLLKKKGFRKRKKGEKDLEYLKYELNKIPGKLIVNANFGDDINLATEFAAETLKNILKIPPRKLEVSLG